jgi:biotin carboxyl carrier protein
MKKLTIKVFALFILATLIFPKNCLSMVPDFLDNEDPQNSRFLRCSIKIPLGLTDETAHHLVFPTGTLITEISSKISQKRVELGLSPHIPLDQQHHFLQGWQTAKDITITAPMSSQIIKICVKQGDRVKRGESVCIMETMKMEHWARSPCSGKIVHCCIQKGEKVGHQTALFTLLPDVPSWEDGDAAQILAHRDVLLSFFPWEMGSVIEKLSPDAGVLLGNEDETIERDLALENENLPFVEIPQGEEILSTHIPLEIAAISPLVKPVPQELVDKNSSFSSLPILSPDACQNSPKNISSPSPREDETQEVPMKNKLPHPAVSSQETTLSSCTLLEAASLLKQRGIRKAERKMAHSTALYEIESYCSNPQAVGRGKSLTAFEEIDYDSLFSLIKWVFGLFTLLILLTKPRKKYELKTLKSFTILNGYGLLAHKKRANNRNDKLWPQKTSRGRNRRIPIRKCLYVA